MSIVELHLPVYDIKFTLLKGSEGVRLAKERLGEHAEFMSHFEGRVAGSTIMMPDEIDGFGEAVVLLNTRDLGVIAHEAYHLAIDLIYWVVGEEPSYSHQETLAHVSEYLFRLLAREMGHSMAASASDVVFDA